MARARKKTPRVKGVSHEEVLGRQMRDPEFRFYYEQRKLVQEVALAVRAMRARAKITQAQLAKLVGVSQPMIARIEKGREQRTPRWEMLRKISIALNMQMRLSFMDVGGDSPPHLVEVDGTPAAEMVAEYGSK
jgi:DNA-binding XRE family transcriptional regulator